MTFIDARELILICKAALRPENWAVLSAQLGVTKTRNKKAALNF
jgi:hypothetical protein